MLLTLGEFENRVQKDLFGLIADLQTQTQRSGPEEAKAWETSLPKVACLLVDCAPHDIHVLLPRLQNVALEYRLPASSSCADLVLLGRSDHSPIAVILELKNWEILRDLPGPREGLMIRKGTMTLHPSDQVRGYVEYCRHFHDQVDAHRARVEGCVVFTSTPGCITYRAEPNAQLTADFPCYAVDDAGDAASFCRFIAGRIRQPDPGFAKAFVHGCYKQKRSFVSGIGRQIQESRSRRLILLDHQRTAAALVRARVQTAARNAQARKSVILVLGGPGTGKTAVAARVWAELVTDDAIPEGDIVLATTSQAQSSNWSRILNETAGAAARAVTKKATTFCPASTQHFGALKNEHPRAFLSEKHWRHNVSRLRELTGEFRDGARDNQYLVTLCDEAHALINPEHSSGRGQFGFATAFGPQAWHIMRCSRVSVFLLDPRQGFRQRENTTLEDVRAWAAELGAEVDCLSLDGHQFRCAGSFGYITVVEKLLSGRDAKEESTTVYPVSADDNRKVAESDEDAAPILPHKIAPFRVVFHEDPFRLEEDLRQLWKSEGSTVRLVSSYAIPWKTAKHPNPHMLPPEDKDFYVRLRLPDGSIRTWAKVWNHITEDDYSVFIQSPKGSPLESDPLCEVGCPYTVRGFDFDHIGLLWQRDLLWRNGAWRADPAEIHETGIQRLTSAAKRERDPNGPLHRELTAKILDAYRILLTRALRSLHIWCPDVETRAHLEAGFRNAA